ncbi:MAG TPA: hypothetical protein VF152_00515 [Acidimicrobiia bacterium]
MARRSIRRLGLALVAAAFALVATGCVAEVTFTGTKEVTGEASSGPFVVRISCPGATPETEDLTFGGPGTETSSVFVFTGNTTCQITEVDQAGATGVAYTCDEVVVLGSGESFVGGGPGMSVARGAPEPVTCTAAASGIEVAISDPALAEVLFTVTNDFTPEPTTTTTTTPPPPAAQPAAGAPRFTG